MALVSGPRPHRHEHTAAVPLAISSGGRVPTAADAAVARVTDRRLPLLSSRLPPDHRRPPYPLPTVTTAHSVVPVSRFPLAATHRDRV